MDNFVNKLFLNRMQFVPSFHDENSRRSADVKQADKMRNFLFWVY